MSSPFKLPTTALKLHVDLAAVDLSELSPDQPSKNPNILLGQTRAQSALAFGVAMRASGYNVFVMGEPGLGRLTMVFEHLSRLSKELPAPASYAYVDNFANPREPIAVELPPECGLAFSKDIDLLLDNVLAVFPAVFESPTYQQKKTAIERRFAQSYNAALDRVEQKAQALNIALFRESETITFVPVKNNKVLSDDEMTQLPASEREQFHKQVAELEEYLADALLELPQWRRSMAESVKRLDTDTINATIAPLFAELRHKYQGVDDARAYLSRIETHLPITVADYLMPGSALEGQGSSAKKQLLTEQYAPNILVDHKRQSGAPVVYEPHPIYQNLFGRIEYSNDQGAMVTHYRRICAGSLHQANGGYLILDADKLLEYPYVWDGLKRALKAGCIEIGAPYPEPGINAMTLKPEVVPLRVKVILVGSRDIYYLLEELDDEFNEMFKILADFDDYIPLNAESLRQFALLMMRRAAELGARSLTRAALEALAEHSCRLSENQRQLSARINDTLELIGEADVLCRQAQADSMDREHIELALAAREYRNGRLSATILEEMLDGTVLIDTEGEAVGKINGLTVMEVGGSCFGSPVRITTAVHPGSRGIVDVEREAELGQSIHSKGVMILTGYLGHFYAQQFPLAISASIAIEQSYSPIDGDSASLAELCCLISALTRIPIRQSFAITGSINQYGEVQAIGGVNEKIEGFFRLCQARGLTGQHAVIIPAANKRNLMLKQEVIDAVAAGLFAVYVVAKVDEALELLTGQMAGIADSDGNYPETSINFKAIARLKEISEMAAEEDKEDGA